MGKRTATDKRTAIINALGSCLSRKSFDAVTIREIAEEAGIPLGSVYYYFKSKEDILLAQLSQPHQELMELFAAWGDSDPVTDGSFEGMVDELIKLGKDYLDRATVYQPENGLLPNTWAACVSNEAVRALTIAEYQNCYDNIAAALSKKGLDPSLDAHEIAKLLAVIFDGARVHATLFPESRDFGAFFSILKDFSAARGAGAPVKPHCEKEGGEGA